MPYKDKEVQRRYQREWHHRNKVKVNHGRYERKTVERSEVRSLVASAKSVPCMDCGNEFPSFVMDFDHVRGSKSFNISDGVKDKTLDQIKDEISKCDVVCANCHRIRTHGT